MQQSTCLLPTHQDSGGSQDPQEHGTPGVLQRNIEQLDSNPVGAKTVFQITACEALGAFTILMVNGLRERAPKSTTNIAGTTNLNSHI